MTVEAAQPPQPPAAAATDYDIRLIGLTKRFDDVVAVDSVSLDIERGHFFALLGPSGCGKTTTLRMIGGFEEPTEGRIELGGVDVAPLPPYKRDVNTVFTGRLCGGVVAMSAPSSRILPAVGCSNPAMRRSVVVLPQPEGPRSEKNSPPGISMSIRSTATTSSNRFTSSSSRTSPGTEQMLRGPRAVRGARRHGFERRFSPRR